jgi:hypothetical protein
MASYVNLAQFLKGQILYVYIFSAYPFEVRVMYDHQFPGFAKVYIEFHPGDSLLHTHEKGRQRIFGGKGGIPTVAE